MTLAVGMKRLAWSALCSRGVCLFVGGRLYRLVWMWMRGFAHIDGYDGIWRGIGLTIVFGSS